MSFLVHIYHPHPTADKFKEMVILSEAELESGILEQDVREEYERDGYTIEAWELESLGGNWPRGLPTESPLFPE